MNVFGSQPDDSPDPENRAANAQRRSREQPDFQLHAEFQVRPAAPLQIVKEIARLDADLSAYATSFDLVLIAPAACESHPVDWPELQGVREQLQISQYQLDTALLSPLLRISDVTEANKTPGHISVEQLAAAITKTFNLTEIHDYDSKKAKLLAGSRSIEVEAPFDCMVILGIAPDADAPRELNEIGRSRMRAAISLFHSGFVGPLVLAGGSVTSPDELPEAKMMLQFLATALPPSLPQTNHMIHLEPQSRSTQENFLFLTDLLIKENFKRPLVVTSDYHVPRARAIAAELCGDAFQFSFFGASSSHIPLEQRNQLVKREAMQVRNLPSSSA